MKTANVHIFNRKANGSHSCEISFDSFDELNYKIDQAIDSTDFYRVNVEIEPQWEPTPEENTILRQIETDGYIPTAENPSVRMEKLMENRNSIEVQGEIVFQHDDYACELLAKRISQDSLEVCLKDDSTFEQFLDWSQVPWAVVEDLLLQVEAAIAEDEKTQKRCEN